MNARSTAIAAESRSIDESQQRAIAARRANDSKPRNALEAMASRLQVSPAGLKETLLNTVFSGCRNDSEFIALTVVANEYGLNPLTKEIYAFPAKGGGIVPMVSVDGWIRIMNEHPAFDGIEFDHIHDQKGNVDAIEAVIYRKDRNHPIKVIEYLEECRRGTDPWKQMPRRMLRNRALIQGARIAFGFSGIAAEGDEIELDAAPVALRRLPTAGTLAEELEDEIPTFDGETGEQINPKNKPDSGPITNGLTEVDEETARALDADGDAIEEENEALTLFLDRVRFAEDLETMNGLDADWRKVKAEFTEDEQAEVENLMIARRKRLPDTAKPKGEDRPASQQKWLDEVYASIYAATTKADLAKADTEWQKWMAHFDDETVAAVDALFAAKRKELSE